MEETEEARALDIGRDPSVPVGPGRQSTFDATRLDFGHHVGRSIQELAEVDPEYLRWLARHPSGVRYRAEIARVLESAIPHPGDWER